MNTVPSNSNISFDSALFTSVSGKNFENYTADSPLTLCEIDY